MQIVQRDLIVLCSRNKSAPTTTIGPVDVPMTIVTCSFLIPYPTATSLLAPQTSPSISILRTAFSSATMSVSSSHGLTSNVTTDLAAVLGLLAFFAAYAATRSALSLSASASSSSSSSPKRSISSSSSAAGAPAQRGKKGQIGDCSNDLPAAVETHYHRGTPYHPPKSLGGTRIRWRMT